ncbi:MAG TPA: hypothetical protein VFR67_08650 [Pilimelia sp.]|nr:hypothetical protein [Pilimelia sp.]
MRGRLAVWLALTWSSTAPRWWAKRLLRETTFLLVFGARPAIREALLDWLDSGQPAGGCCGRPIDLMA